MPQSFVDVINLWPSRPALARLIGVQPVVVRGWVSRGRIPERNWDAIIAAAKRCGFSGVTYAKLASFSAEKHQ